MVPETDRHLHLLSGPNLWPDYPASFKTVMETWTEKMQTLGMAVIDAMSDGLGCTESERAQLFSMLNQSFWALRVIGRSGLSDESR